MRLNTAPPRTVRTRATNTDVVGVLIDWLDQASAKERRNASVLLYFDAVAEVYPIGLSSLGKGPMSGQIGITFYSGWSVRSLSKTSMR